MQQTKQIEDITGGKYLLIRATSDEDALAKLTAAIEGDDCPCGLPQWGLSTAEKLISMGANVDDYLCTCVGRYGDYERDL